MVQTDLIPRAILDIGEVNDLDILLERILTHVRRFFNADAGSIYLVENNVLNIRYTQNETLRNRLGPDRKLVYTTFSLPIDDRSIAGYVAANGRSLNIPDVHQLDDSLPYHFNGEPDRISAYKTSSMLTVAITNQQAKVIGVMQIINARAGTGEIIPFTTADESQMNLFAVSAALAVERAQLTRNVIMRLVSMAEMRDPNETGPHINRVAAYAVEIYEQYSWNRSRPREEIEKQKDLLRIAAMLHDVGKIGISDLILKKPARLTADEYEIMKMHAILGARIFHQPQSEFETMAAEVALTHHEKWDGSGYPGDIVRQPGFFSMKAANRGLKGEQIPLSGRIVALADVYDALTSPRCYKEIWKEDRVLTEIKNNSGTHFDPEVTKAFFTRLDVIKSLAERFPDTANGPPLLIDP
ncbi:MAG: HD domain-containing protein [Deltaproteobacteria bacterium]|nr:HD domain-containing protein [Candidatus Anaeroferrophillacea bacterium]